MPAYGNKTLIKVYIQKIIRVSSVIKCICFLLIIVDGLENLCIRYSFLGHYNFTIIYANNSVCMKKNKKLLNIS